MNRPLLILSATDPDVGVRATATLTRREGAPSGITRIGVEAADGMIVQAEDVVDLLSALGFSMPTLPVAVVPERRVTAEPAAAARGGGGWNRKRPSDAEIERVFHECGQNGSALARHFGVAQQSANKWINDAGLRRRPAIGR